VDLMILLTERVLSSCCRQAVHTEEMSVSVERNDFHCTSAVLLWPGWTR